MLHLIEARKQKEVGNEKKNIVKNDNCSKVRYIRGTVDKSMGAMNKISYFLSYHSFVFYISKLLYVILYFLHSICFSPCRRLVFESKISGKYLVLVLISLLFYFFSPLCHADQSTAFCLAKISTHSTT